eukprot:5392554-Pleurochrysis_carterae.AAC.2
MWSVRSRAVAAGTAEALLVVEVHTCGVVAGRPRLVGAPAARCGFGSCAGSGSAPRCSWVAPMSRLHQSLSAGRWEKQVSVASKAENLVRHFSRAGAFMRAFR